LHFLALILSTGKERKFEFDLFVLHFKTGLHTNAKSIGTAISKRIFLSAKIAAPSNNNFK